MVLRLTTVNNECSETELTKQLVREALVFTYRMVLVIYTEEELNLRVKVKTPVIRTVQN